MYRLLRELHDSLDSAEWQCVSTTELGGVWDLAWHPDGTHLLSAHGDCAARIWKVDGRDSSLLHRLPHRKFVVSAAWHPVGEIVATGDTQADPVRIWRVTNGEQIEELYQHDSWPYSLDWRFDGQAFVSCGMDGLVLVWSTSDWRVTMEVQPTEATNQVSFCTVRFSPDGTKIVFAESNGKILVWHDQLMVLKRAAEEENHFGTRFAFCKPQPDKIAFAHHSGMVSIWDIGQQKHLVDMPSHNMMPSGGRFRSVDWSPDGKEIAVVGGDSYLRLWRDGMVQPPILAHNDIVNVTRWSPNGRLLATGSDDGRVKIWLRDH